MLRAGGAGVLVAQRLLPCFPFATLPPVSSPTPLHTATRAPQNALLQAARGYASKEVRFGIECRDAVLGGVNKLADAVQVTLGPKVCARGCLVCLSGVDRARGWISRRGSRV